MQKFNNDSNFVDTFHWYQYLTVKVQKTYKAWCRHQMETFSALLAICAGNSPVPGEVPPQKPVTRSFDVFFDLHLNKRLSKQSWCWWFETLSRPLWRHCNGIWTKQVSRKHLVFELRHEKHAHKSVYTLKIYNPWGNTKRMYHNYPYKGSAACCDTATQHNNAMWSSTQKAHTSSCMVAARL